MLREKSSDFFRALFLYASQVSICHSIGTYLRKEMPCATITFLSRKAETGTLCPVLTLKRNMNEYLKGRETLSKKEEAYRLFRQGLKLNEIAEKLGIPSGTVRGWKSKGKWEKNVPENVPEFVNNGTQKRNRRQGGQSGNKNAAGRHKGKNLGGAQPLNRTAEIHGLYSRFLPPETLDIMDGLREQDPKDALWDQILNQRALILRSQKIFEMKRGEKTEEIISDGDMLTSYQIQEPWDKEAQYLTAFSRAQATLQSMLKTYFEMEGRTKEEAAAGSKDWKTAILELARRRQEKEQEKMQKDGNMESPGAADGGSAGSTLDL